MKRLTKLLLIGLFGLSLFASCEDDSPNNGNSNTENDKPTNNDTTTTVIVPKDTVVIPNDTSTIIIPKDTIITPNDEIYNLNDFYGAWKLTDYKLDTMQFFVQNNDERFKIIVTSNNCLVYILGLNGALNGENSLDGKITFGNGTASIKNNNILCFGKNEQWHFYILEKTPETMKLQSIMYGGIYLLNRTKW